MRIYIGNGSHPSSSRHLWTGWYAGVGRAWGKKELELTSNQEGCCTALGLWGRCWVWEGPSPFLFWLLCLVGFGFVGFFFPLCAVLVGQTIVSCCKTVALLDPGTMEQGQLWSSQCFWRSYNEPGVVHLPDQLLSGWTIIASVCTLCCWRCAT